MLRIRATSLAAAVACLLLTLTAIPAQADPSLFQSPMQYPGTPGIGHGAAVSADFNGDSYPDPAVVDLAVGHTIITDDFNHDGRSDLAVTQLLGQTAVLLYN